MRHHAQTATPASRAASDRPVAIGGVVGRGKEDLLTAIATLRNMVGQAGNDDAGETGHKD